jgi:CBS domain-containing protein
MNCGSIMTRNPSCCLPGDSVSTAARIMKQQDVGPVLVVSDHNRMQLVGIVTDRDIALNVVGEGRDPYSTRVDSIMTSELVTCTSDENVMEAVKRMADYQVRRIPVVDSNKCVIGIISQADIARNASEDSVGEMVEEISQPWGMGEWPEGRHEAGREGREGGFDAPSALAIGALCVGVGAGLMYMFDPTRGGTRRARVADKSSELWTHRNEMVDKTKHAITDKAQGLMGTARAKLGKKGSRESETAEHEMAGQSTPGTYL